jgi:hypothetical protein
LYEYSHINYLLTPFYRFKIQSILMKLLRFKVARCIRAVLLQITKLCVVAVWTKGQGCERQRRQDPVRRQGYSHWAPVTTGCPIPRWGDSNTLAVISQKGQAFECLSTSRRCAAWGLKIDRMCDDDRMLEADVWVFVMSL